MAHVLVCYTLLVVIIIRIMFVKLRKCWRMLKSAVSLGTPQDSATQKLSVIIIIHSVKQRLLRSRLGSDAAASGDFLRERLQRAFTRANQLH